MKICVYAICKNEKQFAARWAASMSEADEIYVLDTGSTDGSAEALEALGVRVTRAEIRPWRFDTARNRSLELVPEDADLCVCTDLDEVLRPGWRAALERVWTPEIRQVRYRYTWSFQPDGSEGCVFWIEKMHARHNFRWVHPVHETLEYTGQDYRAIYAEGVQLDHRPDPQKSRAQYLPLLELAFREAPQDDRSAHYLGREYLFHRRWEDCIRTLQYHLTLPTATWPDERCASMRYIASAYRELGKPKEALRWLCRAVGEAPHLREPWLDFARFAYAQAQWDGVLYLIDRALEIETRPRTYITQADAWGPLPYDMAAMAAWNTGQYARAAAYCEQALALSPEDTRLQGNLALMRARAEA